MASLPYMQLYIADYLADTAHLTAAQHGAYLLLMFNYWQRGKSFKAVDEHSLNVRLASVVRMSNEEWEKTKVALEEFFEITETEWKHSRIERDLEAVNAKSEKARLAGKASGARRKENKNERQTNVERPLIYKDTDKDTDKDSLKGKQKFSPPSLEDVTAYCQERGNNVDPSKWLNHYKAKGWMIGKNKMKDWKAAVLTWEKTDKKEESEWQ